MTAETCTTETMLSSSALPSDDRMGNKDSDSDEQVSDSEEMLDAMSSDENTDGGSDVRDDTNTTNLTENSAGLANVMAKILGKKTPRDSKPILAKSLTTKEILKKKKQDEVSEPEKKTLAMLEKKKLWEEMCRVKPHPLDRERERRLQKIATRGVVQLFNAVKKQQKSVNEKLVMAGGSENRREDVMKSVTKGAFLDLLKGTKVNVSKDNTPQKAQGGTEDKPDEGKWKILRDDFMMGASMKDWDKDSSGEESNELSENDSLSEED